MSILRYGQYGQVGADGVWRNKEKDGEKTDDKNGLKISKQQDVILNHMEAGKEYRLQDFCDLLGVKDTRTKEILKPLISEGKIIVLGKNKDRRYKLS